MQTLGLTREILGKRLREARGDISLTRAAAEIDVSADTLTNYETGKSEPSYRQVIALSILYDRPLEWFGAPPREAAKVA